MPRYVRTIRSDEIYHYGRRGMKWYQHLFGPVQKIGKYAAKQVSNVHKNLTSEEHAEKKRIKQMAKAERRAEKLEEKKYKLEEKREKRQEREYKEALKEQNKQEKIAEKHEKFIRESDAETIYKHRAKLSDDELARAYKRLQAENNIKSLMDNGGAQKQGQQFVNNSQKNNTKSLVDAAINGINTLNNVSNSIDTAERLFYKTKSTIDRYTPEGRQATKDKKAIINYNEGNVADRINNFLSNYDRFTERERQDYLNKMATYQQFVDLATSGILPGQKKKPKGGK